MAIAGWGTQTVLRKDGTVTIVPKPEEYTLQEGEAIIGEVRDIRVHFPICGAVTAEIDLFPHLDRPLENLEMVLICHDGVKRKKVISIEFEDGSRWPR